MPFRRCASQVHDRATPTNAKPVPRYAMPSPRRAPPSKLCRRCAPLCPAGTAPSFAAAWQSKAVPMRGGPLRFPRCAARSLPMPSEPMRCRSNALRGDAMPLRRYARPCLCSAPPSAASVCRAVALRFHPVRCPRPAAQTKADAVPCRAKPLLCPPKPLPCLALRLLAVAPPCLAHLRRYNPVLCPRSAVRIMAGPSRCMPAHFSAVAVIRCRTASRRSRRRRCRRSVPCRCCAIARCHAARRSPATP